MTCDLLLLANNHGDPELVPRLRRALEVEQPDLITIEGSPGVLELLEHRKASARKDLKRVLSETAAHFDLAASAKLS